MESHITAGSVKYEYHMPSLYVVSTPIGNLEDITLRALRILKEVSLIACEDTRTTRKLLQRYEITTATTSYTEHNHKYKTPQIMKALASGDVALVSEAGTPAIHDPGLHLVTAALANGFDVVPIPGPSAVMAALAASGLPCDRFTFLGFLPGRQGQRRRLWESVKDSPYTLVAFEAPHRLRASLQGALSILGDRRIVAGREITKLHEEWFRGSISEALSHFTEPRGEFTLVIEAATPVPTGTEAEALEMLRALRAKGVRAQQAVRQVSETLGLQRHSVYSLWLLLK